MKKKESEKMYNVILKNMYKKVGKKTTYLKKLHTTAKQLFGKRFLGIFASNTIPTNIKKGELCIVNLDKSWESGSHWVGLGRAKDDGFLYLYDSFGRDIYNILPELKTHKKVKSTEQDAEQHEDETDCGARSLAFLSVLQKKGGEYAKWI